jgi:hypothetical protein
MADDARVERVARAICLALGIEPDLRVTRQQPNRLSANASLMVVPNEAFVGPAWKEHRHAAIAAIEAMETEKTTNG